jgi:hypothetical protein
MPGLDPGIHAVRKVFLRRGWIAGSSGAKTRFALLPGNDDEECEAAHPTLDAGILS